ncbi:MaoC family dehydratase [Gordonia sp. N1V]|uniref:MaoC family dehydratase n=1 Tax=Gordonia sp. N1V TaxID=3034163 RepID=UPI0023E3452D|nr:MaoC family dehydratase [Gordonia sp. N1V]MDF3281287.1 MaoC family dehydratase [Gordonia sp. N1V]
MSPLYFEDLAAGQRYAGTTTARITADDIRAFAEKYDPQPFHLSDEGAAGSVFGSLAASGWHTAAITMQLLVASEFRPAGGIVGAGFDELSWPRPVRPDDELRVESDVLEVRPSRSNPRVGIVKLRTVTFNQDDKPVQTSVGNIVVPTRSGSPAADAPA